MQLVDAFRKLRAAWFIHHLESHAPEREWEDDDRSELREKQNVELRRKYDAQTEDIIAGHDRPLCPRSAHDMEVR